MESLRADKRPHSIRCKKEHLTKHVVSSLLGLTSQGIGSDWKICIIIIEDTCNI